MNLDAGDFVSVHTQDVINEPQVLYYAHNEIRFYGYLLEAL